MISIKLLDSISDISKKINISLSELLNQELSRNKVRIQSECRSLASSWIQSCPEMTDLAAGLLSGPFGLYKGSESNIAAAITNSVSSSVAVQLTTINKSLTRGGIVIYFQPSNFINLLELPEGHVNYEGGDLHWLKWMLEMGDKVIVQNYN